MEALKKLIEALPFPVIVGLAFIVAVAWLIKEYNGLGNYSQVLQNKLYQSLVVIVCLGLVWGIIR
jgi:high-affinity Fe2+/Pb2+ permease